MAIRVTMQENELMQELQAKLGEANIELVFDEDDVKVVEPKKDDEEKEED